MAALVVGGVTVLVARDGADQDFEEYGGDRARMEDGSLRTSVKGQKNVWSLRTAAPLTGANADTLIAAIRGAPPVTCTGDILGASFSCAGQVHKKLPVSVRGTVKFHVHFTLFEI
jgi:hypothetical protein